MAPEGLEPAIDRARTRVGTRTQRRSLLWAADPDGFFIAEFPGEPVGSVAAVAYGPSFGFGGLYVARPELGVVGSATTCGRRQPLVSARGPSALDGVPAQDPNYAEGGSPRTNVRYRGSTSARGAGQKQGATIRDPFEEVASYDHAVFGVSRESGTEGYTARSPIHLGSFVGGGRSRVDRYTPTSARGLGGHPRTSGMIARNGDWETSTGAQALP